MENGVRANTFSQERLIEADTSVERLSLPLFLSLLLSLSPCLFLSLHIGCVDNVLPLRERAPTGPDAGASRITSLLSRLIGCKPSL